VTAIQIIIGFVLLPTAYFIPALAETLMEANVLTRPMAGMMAMLALPVCLGAVYLILQALLSSAKDFMDW